MMIESTISITLTRSTIMTLELLTETLMKIEAEASNIPEGTIYLHELTEPRLVKLVDRAVGLAEDQFVNSDGTTNFSAIAKINYRIGPGEKDSFGWLTGVIYTKVGQIVFG